MDCGRQRQHDDGQDCERSAGTRLVSLQSASEAPREVAQDNHGEAGHVADLDPRPGRQQERDGGQRRRPYRDDAHQRDELAFLCQGLVRDEPQKEVHRCVEMAKCNAEGEQQHRKSRRNHFWRRWHMEEKKLERVDQEIKKAKASDDGAAKAAGEAVGVHCG